VSTPLNERKPSPVLNRRLVLAQRPESTPGPEHFRRDDAPAPEPGDGQFLVRNEWLSIDPAQRGWLSAGGYAEPVAVGAVMRSLAVGVVAASRDPRHAPGERLYGWFGWQDYCVADEAAVLARVDPANGAASSALGIFGIPGLTAFLALQDIGRPQPGETVLVSTAAGAVGSLVGQLARRAGCRVVGLAGSDGKVAQCLAEFGYHAALNYRAGLDAARLRAPCPQGIDVFFDNTAGGIADAVWPLMNVRGRIVQCGTAAVAAWEPPPLAPRRERLVLTRRLRHEGFLVFDHRARFAAAIAQLGAWVRQGELRHREDIEPGLERAPAALAALLRGENRGKKIVQLVDGERVL
jgi:NADPH-dependent curcumin reductase CurA